jgi:formylglycine-generating enzyme required for sulfatase activity
MTNIKKEVFKMWQCKKTKNNRLVFARGIIVFLSFLFTLTFAEPQKESGLNQAVSPYSSSYALVIGIQDYHNWPSLTRAVNDAVMVGNELEKMGFKVTYRSNLNLSEIDKVLKKFFYDKKIDNKSRLFLWYSGHGHRLGGEGFLLPADAPGQKDKNFKANFKMKAFPIKNFDKLLRQTEAKHVYMVFDSCFSTDIFEKKEIKDSPPLEDALKNPVRQYLCSYDAGKKMRGDSKFREMFIKALRKEVDADRNKDNCLTATELSLFIKENITKISSHYGKLRDFNKGDFVFFPRGKYFDYFMDSLKSGGDGPEMILIPPGSFIMGDLQGKGFGDERPLHEVNIAGIAVGRYEVTFEEYDRFCEATERKKPGDAGWRRGKRPVTHVSWVDALVYTKWLSEQTGYIYRLPTEAEWEYFARSGTDTNYCWGNEIGKANASCDGCGARWGLDAEKSTAPVGSFKPNPFGIYDTVGNVWEWTCSVYTDTYDGKETKRLDKIITGGEVVVLRGGAWDEEPEKCRVSHRKVGYPGERSKYIGFRVVRELK